LSENELDFREITDILCVMKYACSFWVLLIAAAGPLFCQESGDFSLRGRERSMNSDLAQVWLERGQAKEEEGDMEAARADYEKAALLDPSLTREAVDPAFRKQAEQWVRKGRKTLFDSEKITCFRKAIRLDPSYADAHYRLGRVLLKRRDYEGAEASFQTVLELEPGHRKAAKYLKKTRKKSARKKEL
jgi:tetratricopeptide (TPR) repeat protein